MEKCFKRANAAAGGQKSTSGAGAEGNKCPLCKIPHKRKDRTGKDTGLNADRFYGYEKWMKLDLEAKVKWVQQVQGCILCGDWSGTHQNNSCPTLFPPCPVANCGKLHMK